MSIFSLRWGSAGGGGGSHHGSVLCDLKLPVNILSIFSLRWGSGGGGGVGVA